MLKSKIFIVLILILTISLMSYGQEKKYFVQHVRVTEIKDVPEMPILSKALPTFQSVNNWLSAVCNSKKPTKAIETYHIYFLEEDSEIVLLIVGLNFSQKNDVVKTRIDFYPENSSYSIPFNTFKDLTHEELLRYLCTQIKEFTKSEKFINSFLSEAKSLTTNVSEELWVNRFLSK